MEAGLQTWGHDQAFKPLDYFFSTTVQRYVRGGDVGQRQAGKAAA
jgi:hypothetical protein